MRLALLHPEPEKGGRGKKKTVEETSTLFSAKRLQQARAVLRHSRDLALAVRDGPMTLDQALDIVKKAKQPIESEALERSSHLAARVSSAFRPYI